MKRVSLLFTAIAGLALLALATPTFAAENGKEHSVTGEAKCAKCALHQADKCQTVIQAEGKNGKMVTYYLTDNDIAKNFHEEICKEPKKVTAMGTVKKGEGGKMELTASKIEVAK
jgi:hypothetical protein